MKHPQDWDKLPWACLNCDEENCGLDMLCSRAACRDEPGSSRGFVLGNILTKMGQEMATLQEVEDQTSEIWPVVKMMEVLLSPHNRAYSALLTGAFRAPHPSENCCECCTTTNQPLITLRPSLKTPSSPLSPNITPSSSPPAPALPGEPLQAQNVDDTVMEYLDQPHTSHTLHTHTFVPTMAEEQALQEEAASGPNPEAKRMRMDLVHLGTNGLLTFPKHSTNTASLPTATVTPTIMEESTDSISLDDSWEFWLDAPVLDLSLWLVSWTPPPSPRKRWTPSPNSSLPELPPQLPQPLQTPPTLP